MKYFVVFTLFFLHISYGQVILDADGPGNTYELITSVLAPNGNPIETPDCNHEEFGRHIDEVYDNDLNSNVFRFHIHTENDNDRCKNFDRQRNEIKSYDKSPDNLLGIDGEIVIYKWKFKLEDGFQSSPNFTHIHQLKSVGGSLESMPMYTLTTRKESPDQLELRYAVTDSQITLTKTDLSPFIGVWLEVTETISYGTSGTYEIDITKVSDNTSLLSYSNDDIINWRTGAEFVRPKWGIYRSLNNVQDLRDETVLFANFSIEEVDNLAISKRNKSHLEVFPNPVKNTLQLKNIHKGLHILEIMDVGGRIVLHKNLTNDSSKTLDVSMLLDGVYFLHLKGKQTSTQSQLIIVSNN